MASADTAGSVLVDLVVKFGGAAITDKSSLETLRPEALEQGATLLKRCLDAGQRVIVVHGAGSFGHHQAKQYKVNEGLNNERDFHGFCVTRNSVTTLNKHVVEYLTNQKVPAVACPAFPAWQTVRGVVQEWPREAILRVLAAGLVPVFHGDCVLDTHQGCTILSGDIIIQTLCDSFSVKRVVFLSDVEGVYDKPPCEEGASLLRVVQLTQDGRIRGNLKMTTSTHDVTGGMLNKLRCAHSIVKSSSGSTRVFISKLGSAEASKLCMNDDSDSIKLELEATEVQN